MEKVTRTIFIAYDGSEFDTESECIHHEMWKDNSLIEDPFYRNASLGKSFEVFKGCTVEFIEEGNRYHFLFKKSTGEVYRVNFSNKLQNEYLNSRITIVKLMQLEVLNLTRQDKTIQHGDYLVLKAGLWQNVDEITIDDSFDYNDLA